MADAEILVCPHFLIFANTIKKFESKATFISKLVKTVKCQMVQKLHHFVSKTAAAANLASVTMSFQRK